MLPEEAASGGTLSPDAVYKIIFYGTVTVIKGDILLY